MDLKELFNSSNIMNTTIGLAAVGYLLNLLKEIPINIFYFIRDRLTKSIYVSSDHIYLFRNIENKIFNDYNRLFRKHIHAQSSIRLAGSSEYSITPGSYITFDFKTLSFICINKNILNIMNLSLNNKNDAQLYSIKLSFFGLLNKNKHLEYKKLIEDYNNNKLFDTRKYFRVMHPFSIWSDPHMKYLPKKNEDKVYDKRTLFIINKHLNNFINNKEIYKNHSITYKTGILLYGPPGTGKSSLVRYIASKLSWTIYNIDINNFKDSLESFLRLENNKNTIVLIEEIDLLLKSDIKDGDNKDNKTESNGKNKINEKMLSTLLTFLDGVNTPEDIIIVATTNNYEFLPDNLTREGRFDLKLELKGITYEDALNMCKGFNVEPEKYLKDYNKDDIINPSKLQSKILLNMYK